MEGGDVIMVFPDCPRETGHAASSFRRPGRLTLTTALSALHQVQSSSIAFVAGDDARFVTGVNLLVDGWMSTSTISPPQ